jgi:gas vesicle protein
MKKLIIGLVVGVVIGFAGARLMHNTYSPDIQKNVLSKADASITESEDAERDDKFGTVTKVVKMASPTGDLANISSQPKTIEEYQTAYANLQEAVIQQNKTLQKLTAENNKLTDELEESGGGRAQMKDLTASEVEKAKANIEASLSDATAEYAEVLKSALESFKSGDVLPDSDALLRHYADEPDFAWSDVARAYIQNYFAAQAGSNIQLIQLNCRKTYCEVYGFYSDGEKLDNPRQAGSQIQSAFNALEQAPGFSNLFVGLESASISIDSENSYMTFHNFIRSNRQ